VRSDFEHGVLAIDGEMVVEGQPVGVSEICYLGGRRETVHLEGHGRAFLVGGTPFEEQLVMWWNFIGRSHDEIVAFRREWNDGGSERFGRVDGFQGDRLLADADRPAEAARSRTLNARPGMRFGRPDRELVTSPVGRARAASAALAQSAERLTRNEKVVGSIPTGGSRPDDGSKFCAAAR
jgi:hypothetical protein